MRAFAIFPLVVMYVTGHSFGTVNIRYEHNGSRYLSVIV